MLTLLPDQGAPADLWPDARRRALSGNATAGIGRSPCPSRDDGNSRGIAGLNLHSETQRTRVRLAWTLKRKNRIASRSRLGRGSPFYGCGGVPPSPRERSAADKLEQCPSCTLCKRLCGHAGHVPRRLARAVARPFRLYPGMGDFRSQKSRVALS